MKSPFTVDEIEFRAEEELVEIIPRFAHGIFHFISGDFGPLVPPVPVKVPLWLAVTLRKRQKCKIQPPSWIDYDHLSKILENEQNDLDSFQELPFHYIEIAASLIATSAEDIPDCERVRTILEDIQNLRWSKIRRGMQLIADKVKEDDERITAVKLTNVSALELHAIRPFMTGALNQFYRLSQQPSAQPGLASRSRRRSIQRSSPSASTPLSAIAQLSSEPGSASSAPPPSTTRKLRRFR
uniref:DNA replication complex GINS protein PSF2 n=1 Tax=Octactis speculum TaxID=3111310 RepID=A0A7S2D0T8_9STRA